MEFSPDLLDYQFSFRFLVQTRKVNPRELNPYLKDNGSGYPEDSEGTKAGGEQLLSSAVVGDGGASWRLKALKRAKEQAAREGRKLDEVDTHGLLIEFCLLVSCMHIMQ